MKRLFCAFAILFYSSQNHAQCFEFELLGEGQVTEESLVYTIAKDTLSEVKLVIPLEDQNLFAPYINRWAKSRLILDQPQLDFNTKIVKVLEVDYETPDPLNMTSIQNIKKLREVVCPKR